MLFGPIDSLESNISSNINIYTANYSKRNKVNNNLQIETNQFIIVKAGILLFLIIILLKN